MNDIRVGIVGLGPRGLNWIDSFRRVKGCRIVALCERYEPLLAQALQFARDPAIVPYTDFSRMLKEAPLDAVGVCTAPDDHPDLICQSLAAGKHVASEVPLCYSVDGCWKVIRAVEKSGGSKFMMAEQHQYTGWAQAWKKMVAAGDLGKVVFGEGQYLHGLGRDRFYVDSVTGRRLTIEEARNNPRAARSRYWTNRHPLFYLPHELSALLGILDDRIKSVTAMSTRRESYYYEGIPFPDIEVALMRTEKDTLLKLAVGFQVPTLKVEITAYHWYHLMGTKGRLETARSGRDTMKMWLPEQHMTDMAAVTWDYLPHQLPPEAIGATHHNADYFPMAEFIRCIREDAPSPMDVYRSAEITVPALLAGISIDQGSTCLEVPAFRPCAARRAGELPT